MLPRKNYAYDHYTSFGTCVRDSRLAFKASGRGFRKFKWQAIVLIGRDILIVQLEFQSVKMVFY